YPGPIGSVISAGLFGQNDFGHLAQASSLCGACKEACPVDIDLPKLLLRVRAGGLDADKRRNPVGVPWIMNLILRIFTWLAGSEKRFSVGLKLASFLSNMVAPRKTMLRMPAFSGWGMSRDLPRPARRSFRQIWASGDISPAFELQTGLDAYSGIKPTYLPDSSAFIDKGERKEHRSLLKVFVDELVELNATYTLCNLSDLPEELLSYLRTNEIGELMTWEADFLPAGLLDYLNQNGIQLIYDVDASVKVGLTGCQASIAKTGSIAISSGLGKPMLTSLLPEIHLVVVKASQIFADLKPVLLQPEIQSSSTAVLISGPSRTADIEMTLTVGVHGPRQVHVFCIIDQ
ncbi:MAG: LUD domain-containing protein, partial [Anaerolineales bacterium]